MEIAVMNMKLGIRAIILPVMLGACATVDDMRGKNDDAPKQTIADKMEAAAEPFEAEASARTMIAESWRKGDTMARMGDEQQIDAKARKKRAERDIERAEREIRQQQQRLAEAQKALADAEQQQIVGKQMVEDGRKLRATSEAEFKIKYPDASLN
jgi:hypothetical protein